jgi:hypothetical protein
MRVFSTTRGVGCIQVGRLLDGKLGALGQDGATCHLTSRSWIGGTDACTPTLKVPVGYVSPKRTVYTSAQVAAPLLARLLHATRGGYEIIVSFTSRVAITHARSKYLFKWHEPNMPHRSTPSTSPTATSPRARP